MVSSCPEQRTAAATTTATATPSTARGADRQRGRHHIQQLQLQPHQQRLRQRLGIGKPGSSGTSSATPAATAKLVKSRVTVVSSTTHVASATTANASVSSTTPTASSSSALKLAQPLYKHRFYLEIKNHSVAAKIEQKIKHLGGKVELFLDKEVTHVISDREGYVDVKGTISPKTLLSNQSSTTPTAYGHGGDRTPSARPKSRVRAILEKARNTPTQAENDLFVEAEKLGISIWTTDKANEWLNKVAASVKISKQKKFYELKGNFIKFESFDRQNRPVFKELPLWPYLNLRGYLGDLAVITKPPPARTAGGTSKQPQQSVVAGRQPVTPLPAATLTQERNRAPAGPGAGDAVAAGLCQRNMTRKSSRIGTVASLAASRQPPPHLSGRKQNGTINPLAASEADDQPGYCELCRIAFPHQDDHLHSEPHTKNAREHAGFLQLDELIADGATHLDSFLKINNFKENGKLPLIKMPRTRTASLSDKLKAAPVSPTVSEFGNGRGRPRRHAAFTNSYLEIGVDDEKPEGARESRELRSSKSHTAPLKEVEPESPDTWNSGRPKRSCILRPKRTSADERLVVDNRTYYKVEVLNAKLRSSTAPSAKENVHLTPTRISPVPSPGLSNDREPMERHRRITTPARTTEPAPHSPRESAIVTPASTRTLTTDKRSVSEGGSKNAGSIVVKFKRMRSSELRQLNNEAVNFLFPRKDESSSEDDIDENCPDSTVETIKDVEQSILISSEDESVVEDASAQDSRSSSDAAIFITPVPKNSLSPVVEEEEEQEEGSIERPQRQRGKQRRRTHAQAFITDNQQYYKFETPSSRYQGSTIMSSHQLSSGGEHAIPPMKTPRRNGETPSVVPKRRRSVVTFADTPEEKNVVTNTPAFVSGDMANGINSSPDTSPNMSLPLDELKFSFEQQPKTEPWYEPFTRQDQGLEIYKTFGESQFSKPFRMPYEMGRLPPLNPRHCFDQYELLVKHLLECPGVNDESAPATPSCGDSITPTEGTSSIDGESSNSRPLSTLDDDESNAAAALDRVNTTNCAAETDDSADSAPINDQHVDGGSSFDVETVERIRRRKKRRKAAAMLMANNKNPRKSPRQHASTLAILSSLLQQRKRRELNRSKSDHDDSKLSESDTTLATISEEGSMLTAPTTDDVDGRSAASSRLSSAAGDTTLAKADIELAQLLDQLHRIESALSTNDADDAELDLDLDVQPYHGLDLLDSAEPALLTHYRTDPIAILQDYHRQRDELANTPGACVSGRGKRTFASGRKPGRRPKKRRTNMTGWPNKNRRIYHNTTATTTSTTPVLVVKTEVLDDEDDDEEADAMMDHDGNSNCTADDADDLPSPLCSPRVRVEVDSSLNHDEDIISENNEKVLSVSDSAIAIKSLEVHSSSAEHKTSRLCQNHQDDYIKPASTKSVRLISVDSATDRVVDLAQWETAERALNEAVSNSYNDNGNDDEDDHSDNESERVNRRRSIVVISNSSAAAASSLSMSSSPHRNMQPVVRVAKLDTSSPIRTPMSMKTTPRKSTPPSSTLVTPSPLQRARRRMPASPRSPRVLRKPRGRWYRER